MSKINGTVVDASFAGKARTVSDIEVAVIGAGPYGLSAGAHLKAKGLPVRVFGEPMGFWAEKMPEGMLLRSPREASNISDPDHAFTLDAYEAASRTQPSAPVPIETFVEYGRWFRHQLNSDLDKRNVSRVDREGNGFRLALADGLAVRCSRVVIAAGIGSFCRKPVEFSNLPSDMVSHCYEGRKLREFSGRQVVVIGAGQSALESAALLHEAGAYVELIAKISELRWIGMHGWLHKMGPISSLLYSKHDVGPLGISRLVAAPRLVNKIPLKIRDKIRKRAVRPAGSRWLPARLEKVKVTTGCTISSASVFGNEVSLKLNSGRELRVDHVLLGTGYDVNIARYDFLSPEIVRNLAHLDGYPRLTGGFCSSVPGLHFIGATAARSYGPLLYFVAGTEFASRELISHISRGRTNAK
ncbi:MAG: NAD(P)-binding domain-containing protein [Terriglobales bacterium]